MTPNPDRNARERLLLVQPVAWTLAAVAAFELAYCFATVSGPAMVIYGFCLAALANSFSSRACFYGGLAIGSAVASIQLQFLLTIFGIAAAVLWLIFALWVALFLLATRITVSRFPATSAWLPGLLWIGFEYFRSELYPLRFSWVTPALALVDSPWESVLQGGQYLTSGLLVSGGFLLFRSRRRGAVVCVVALAAAAYLPIRTTDTSNEVTLAGMQLEHPDESSLPQFLDELSGAAADADVLVLSEYTLDGPIPPAVLSWCRDHDRTLVIGGKDVRDSGRFFNTVFVVGPDGTVIHQQAKSVPIQFFADGLPAESQSVWNSQWGPLGFPICYDLSYSRVIDGYVDAGALLLINPTMDPEHWGSAEHRLHARIPKCRAIEYGLPVFRVASSGVSLGLDAQGRTIATGSFPGQREIVQARLSIPTSVGKPTNWWLGPACVAITIGWSSFLWLTSIAERMRRSPLAAAAANDG